MRSNTCIRETDVSSLYKADSLEFSATLASIEKLFQERTTSQSLPKNTLASSAPKTPVSSKGTSVARASPSTAASSNTAGIKTSPASTTAVTLSETTTAAVDLPTGEELEELISQVRALLESPQGSSKKILISVFASKAHSKLLPLFVETATRSGVLSRCLFIVSDNETKAAVQATKLPVILLPGVTARTASRYWVAASLLKLNYYLVR